MNTSACTACALLTMLFHPGANADPIPDKLSLCVLCHGTDGAAMSEQWPHLAGQNAPYLTAQSIRYRDGLRQDRNGLMAPWVEGLSDEEIRSLAEYYSRQPRVPAAASAIGDPDNGEHLAARCAGCHGLDGISSNENWPHLAGQNVEYQTHTLRAYRDGDRDDPTGIMPAFVSGLSADEIADVSAYYARQGTAER